MHKSIAVAAAVIALSAPASATDFGSDGYVAFGQRAGQVLIYDYQPGVVVRAYWAPPWQGRHYFPVTGTIPRVGRHENLNAPRRHYPPAPRFYREWWTSSVFELPVADFGRRVPLAAASPADAGAVAPPDNAPPQDRFEHLPAEK